MWKSRVLEHHSLSSTVERSAVRTKGNLEYRRISVWGQPLGSRLLPKYSWTYVTHELTSKLVWSWPSARPTVLSNCIANSVLFGKVWRVTSFPLYLVSVLEKFACCCVIQQDDHNMSNRSWLEDAFECLTSYINLAWNMFSLWRDENLNHI